MKYIIIKTIEIYSYIMALGVILIGSRMLINLF